MTKLYHDHRDGMIWIVAITDSGKRIWLYAKAPIGCCIR